MNIYLSMIYTLWSLIDHYSGSDIEYPDYSITEYWQAYNDYINHYADICESVK